jgi:anaerobic ribonucleoside-triphosphate reductase activating protein
VSEADSAERDELVYSRIADRVGVLGPGTRAVVWVHGCPLRCAGCIAPQDLPFEGGVQRSVRSVADYLNALPPDVEGVTFSGGEPMAQAGALAALIDRLRVGRDWSSMAYSGYTLRHLRRHGTADQHALLDRLDILVDGPYVRARHADLLWRGSANQRVHLLSDRHPRLPADRSAGIEVEVDPGSGELALAGVPPFPGFLEAFETAVAERGVRLTERGLPDAQRPR